MLFKDRLVREIIEKYKVIWAIGYAQGVMGWDRETYMPDKGVGARSIADSQLSLKEQELIIALKPLVYRARKRKNLNVYEQAVIRVMKKTVDQNTKIPPKLVEELSKVTSQANVAWKHAREKSDFTMFKPYLVKIVELEKRVAEKIGYKGHIYNAFLDDYEEGFTVNNADKMFGELRPAVKRIMKKVGEQGVYLSAHPLEKVRYKREQLQPINQWIIDSFKLPSNRFRMDVSAHPFTSGLDKDDVRLTTRYEGIDFKRTISSTVHESGHAMYELDGTPELEYTPIDGGVSFGVHEAQSRMWENIIGRSRPFIHYIYPTIKRLPFASRYSEEQIYKYFNVVKPGFIRVDADEISYNMHIILRYEIEKKLVSDKISVSEIPHVWNETMEEYLGIRPKNDALGCLQDVHWSHGSFGYFPAYSIGNVIGATEIARMEKKLGRAFWSSISMGRFGSAQNWFREHIHKWGCIYTPKELQKRMLGDAYNPKYFIKYLENKYIE